MTRRILTLAVAFSASAISGSSSIRAQAAAQDQPSVFRAAARLVEVNVVVMDSHGQPVTDLHDRNTGKYGTLDMPMSKVLAAGGK